MATKRILATVCLRTAVTLALLALFSSVTQAQQVQLSYFKNYFVTGDYAVGGVSLSGKTGAVSSSINFSGVPCTSGPGLFAGVVPCTSKGAQPADVIAAFLYWQTIETTAPCSPQCGSSGSGSFNGSANTFNGVELGNPTVAACAAGGGTQSNAYARVYRADVLRFLPINNTTDVRVGNGTQTFTLTSSSTNTQFVGASLVVVYRLVTPGNSRIAPLRSVLIYDGSFTGTPGAEDLDQTMGGFYQAAKNPAAKMTHIVGNGKAGFRETLTVNGSIPSGQSGTPIDGDQGPGWDVDTFNYNLAANASSVETKVVLSSDCLSWAAIITSVNVQDSDFDGIPDIAEEYGLNFNPGVRYDGIVPLPSPASAPTPATFGTCQQSPSTCVNLPAMGANPLVPDIFVQVDWMYDQGGTTNPDGSPNPPHSHNPQIAALNMVGGVFKAHGINIHFDVGSDNPLSHCQAANSTTIGPCNYQSQNSPYIVPAAYAHGGNAINEAGTLLCPNSVTSSNCAFPGQSNLYSVLGWKFGLDAIRDGDLFLQLPQLFPQDEKDTVHYALFGHALGATTPFSTPEAGSISGIADHPGGDILVTLGLWRSDNAAFDQVGTMLQQAGTLMHELGHNLGLSHGGWSDTPNCMPNYASVMNYLYQVAGLTDAKGNENIDYSYGLLLPLFENALSVKIPMGIQLYRVRYFGPLNSNPKSSLVNTPGQASKAYCTTGFSSQPGQSYVRLEWPSVSTPDWSNGTVPSGTKLGPLDINFDATTGNQLITNETFFDSPDWISLNLQQVSARPNADGFSSNAELAQVGLSQLGLSQLGLSQLGLSQLGLSQLGLSQLGLSQLGLSQLGISDPGTAALGQDQDVNQAQYHASGGGVPPTGLTALVTTTQPSPANPNPGGTGNTLTWVGDPNAVAFEYNVYRCNASAVPGCTPAVLIGTNTGSPVSPTYTDFVNDFVDAAATCPDTKSNVANTCYNTNYTYAVSELPVLTPSTEGPESGLSNSSSSEVNHLFVMGNITPQSIVYGSANPTITVNVYGNGSVTGETCFYTDAASPTAVVIPQNVKDSPYPVYCTGPATVSTTVGVTYNVSYLGHTSSTLTITQYPITITAVASTKIYDGTTSSLSTPLTPSALPYGDTLTWMETYDNPNVFTPLATHVMTPAPTASEPSLLSNYNVTFTTINTGVINQAPASVTPNPATKVYGTFDPTLTGTLTGFYAADGVGATYSRTAGETVAGSPYTISATLSANPMAPAAGLSNYNITYKTANFTITPASASVTPNANQQKVYGQPDPSLTGTLSGFLPSDNVTATYTRVAGQSAGTYLISATLSPSGVLGNYSITYNTANFTITPATLTGTTQPVSYVYGAVPVPPVSTVMYTGFAYMDTAASVISGTLTCVSTAMANSPVGVYTIACSGQSAAPNYTINYVGNTLSITPAQLTGTSQNATATFGAPIPALTAMFSVFVNGDGPGSLTGTLSCTTTAVAGSPAGMYPITCTGQSSPNYNITYNNTGVLTISDSINLSALALNGTAAPTAPTVLTGPVLQLANNVSQTSSAWLGTAIPVSSAFTTTFRFQITPAASSGPNSIGDGFAFVIQAAPTGAATLGATGYGMYIGYDGIPNSIAIEFDTYENGQYDDPAGSHIGIQSLGTQPNTPDHTNASANFGGPTLASFADGNVHTATITYDGSATISVYLDGSATPVLSSAVPINLNTLLGLSGPAYVGFTAATGAAQENSDILSWTWN
jgi:hypothetical protein